MEDPRQDAARYRIDRWRREELGEQPEQAAEPRGSAGTPTSSDRAAYIEVTIQQAIRRGEFDDLPGAGKPIPGLGRGHDPDWWIRRKIESERLTGLGPPALMLRTESAELDDRLDALTRETDVREVLDDFNARVRLARMQLQGGPPVVTPLRDVESEVAAWRARRDARRGDNERGGPDARRGGTRVNIEQVDPALREATTRLPAPRADTGWGRTLARAGMALMPAVKVDGVTCTTIEAEGARLRVYRPEAQTSDAALLWIHGGGYVIGVAKMDDRLCAETARELGMVVVSPEYRLAPKHPFPAAHDDCRAAWRWLRAHASELGVDRDRIAVGGQSAGGGLAAGLVQRLRDEREPVLAQWLLCPMLDDRTAARREPRADDHYIWSSRSNTAAWAAYLGQAPGARTTPAYAVPARRENLAGLPPTWLYVSDIELFADEVVAYADRLYEAGVDTTLHEVSGAPHGFESWAPDTEPARELLAAARGWLAWQTARGAAAA